MPARHSICLVLELYQENSSGQLKFIQTLKFIIVHHKTAESFKISFSDRNQHGPREIPPFFSQFKPTVLAVFAIPISSQHGDRPSNAAVLWQEEGLTCVHLWLFDGGGNLQAVNIKRRQIPAWDW